MNILNSFKDVEDNLIHFQRGKNDQNCELFKKYKLLKYQKL